MFGIIYVTVNMINGKRYIGQHKCSDEKDSYLGSGKILKEAIQKYGKENFHRYTLYRAETEEELDKKEIEFISAFRATENEKYYNINEGGNANRMCGQNNPMYGKSGPLAPSYGRHMSEEQIEQMRVRMTGEKNPMYGKHLSEEQRKRISENQSGERHWNYGKHWSDEVKVKISSGNKGKQGWNKGMKMSDEAKKKLSESKKGIIPQYSDEDRERRRQLCIERNSTKEFKEQVSEANRRFHENGGRRGGKPVVCIETGIVYASGYDACRAVGCSSGLVAACLSGNQKTAKGFHWRYATQEEALEAVIA